MPANRLTGLLQGIFPVALLLCASVQAKKI